MTDQGGEEPRVGQKRPTSLGRRGGRKKRKKEAEGGVPAMASVVPHATLHRAVTTVAGWLHLEAGMPPEEFAQLAAGANPSHYLVLRACKHGHAGLLRNFVIPKSWVTTRQRLFFEAGRHGHVEVARVLIEKGIRPLMGEAQQGILMLGDAALAASVLKNEEYIYVMGASGARTLEAARPAHVRHVVYESDKEVKGRGAMLTPERLRGVVRACQGVREVTFLSISPTERSVFIEEQGPYYEEVWRFLLSVLRALRGTEVTGVEIKLANVTRYDWPNDDLVRRIKQALVCCKVSNFSRLVDSPHPFVDHLTRFACARDALLTLRGPNPVPGEKPTRPPVPGGMALLVARYIVGGEDDMNKKPGAEDDLSPLFPLVNV